MPYIDDVIQLIIAKENNILGNKVIDYQYTWTDKDADKGRALITFYYNDHTTKSITLV